MKILWVARVLSLLFVAFLMLFSLDVFGQGYGFWETVVALLMHNIPAFILLALVLIAWKRELVGAVTFFAAGLLYVVLIILGGVPWYLALSWSMTISGPAFAIGALYLVGWRKKRTTVTPFAATADTNTR